MRRAKSMYVYGDVKSQKLQVRGTPCKCCSRSQQRSSPGLRLRLTPRLVLIARVYGGYHILSSLLLLLIKYDRSISHTPVVEEVADPCDICQVLLTAIYFQAMSCNSSSSVFLNHYRTLRTKQRRGSKASGFRKQCHEGSTTSSHVVTPLVYSCGSTCSSKLCVHFSWNAHILRLSEIRLKIDWTPVRWLAWLRYSSKILSEYYCTRSTWHSGKPWNAASRVTPGCKRGPAAYMGGFGGARRS